MNVTPMRRDRAPRTLAFLLSQVGIHASKRFAERIAALGISPSQFRLLNLVDAGNGESQQAIGEAIQVPASRMVALVDELEGLGFVERRAHPGDRRVRTLHLTPEGAKVLARGRRVARRHEDDLASGLSKAERKQLVALLQKLVDAEGIGAGVHPGLRGGTGRRDRG
jgi:DNA-binding MarR family transcriptional regulator